MSAASLSATSLASLREALQLNVDAHAGEGSHAPLRRRKSLEDRRLASDGPPALLRRSSSVMEDLVLHRDSASDASDASSDLTSDNDTFRMKPGSSRSSHRSSLGERGIRVEDRSDDSQGAFARQVEVTSYSTVIEGAKSAGFVVYDIEITTFQGATLRIRRRYSDWCSLRLELLRTGHRPPRLPSKTSFSKFRDSFLQRRRKLLDFWLKTVLLSPSMGSTKAAKEWCLVGHGGKGLARR